MKASLGRRSAGVLLHPTSLAGPRGGTLGASALEFIDFLADCGQSWWQMLPVCPPDEAGSPYASPSAFAGSPELIDCDLLAAEGFLTEAELDQPRARALRAAFAAFPQRAGRQARAEFEAFRAAEAAWLADHALFCALKNEARGAAWTDWDEDLRARRPQALALARARLASEVLYHEFAQWLFARQWEALRHRARARGVGLIGDIPIYVRHDSVDCWAHQELFQLGPDGRPGAVAGVPPDYFSKTGQRWGNPLYRWERHLETGFAWWVARLSVCAARFDAVRLDHFIGLRHYWEIPAAETTAVNGRWVRAPGDELFAAVRAATPGLEIIAEDLGALTPEVVALRDSLGLPGMKIGQFSFADPRDAPSKWPENCVAYTGTHDNDTARGWWDDSGGNVGRTPEQAERERAAFSQYLGRAVEDPAWDMVRVVWASPARTAIAPMQDLLGLGSEARMNTPGTHEGNWAWRLESGALTARLAGRLALLTGATGRAPMRA